jgi:hypothetical protein
MRSRSKITGAAALGAALVVSLAAAPSASANVAASPPQLHVIRTVSSAYVGPLQFAVEGNVFYVADSFTSTLNRLDPDGHNTVIATGPDPSTGGDIAGVAVDPVRHALAYTSSTGDHSVTTLTIRQPGAKPVIANLSGFEAAHNPDQRITYGIAQPVDPATTKCIADALAADPDEAPPGAVQGNISYPGIVDSHPYAVASLGDGSWAVADAGGNDILRVDRWGHVSLIAVLPAQEVQITPAFAAANGVNCDLSAYPNLTYGFEAVPTDVEVGPDHALYVTTLPGGPGGSADPGSVYRLSRWGGNPQKIATGFNEATNLAIDPWGGIYVAELGAGTISKVVRGHAVPVASLAGVVADEWANRQLYASTAPAAVAPEDSTSPPAPGSIVELGLTRNKK